ncbi:MAG: helix-turn-helix domain-containing protein [Pyrinomonadaceae bacterium]|nr:helix-turn-helix domain-containing protein [Sphingobacteriaceae bacterium]
MRFEHLTSENGLPQNTIHGIVKDKYGFMWFGTWAGLCRYDGYKFTTYRTEPNNPHSLINNRIHNLYKDKNQDIWVKTFDTTAVCRYNYETNDFIRVPMKKVPAKIVESNDRPRHYIRTYFIADQYKWSMDTWTKSLVQTHIPTNKTYTYRANPSNRWSLNDELVADIYLDNHNILWVGTYSYGVNKANINAKPFSYFHHDLDNKNTIIDNNIRAICEDNTGKLWIGTRDKGITVIDRKNDSYQHFTHSDKAPNSLVYNQIRKIYQDKYGFIWIGTKKGLDKFNPSSKTFIHYGKALPSTAVYTIMEDRKNNLWIGTWRGMCKYDRTQDRFINYDTSTSRQNRNVRVLLEDKANNLWMGSEGGGITVFKRNNYGKINESLSPITTFLSSVNNPNTLSDNRIYTLYEDKSGMVWIGTGNGLNRYNPRTKKFRQFSIKEGLPDAMIAGVVEGSNNCLWISHKRGLSKMNKKTFAIQNYTLRDGLQSNEFSEDTFFQNKITKELFFGGNDGFNTFYPDSIKEETYSPQIAFTDLQVLNQPVKINQKINGRVILSKSLNLSKEITLSHEDKSFAIEFAALHYTNPQGNKYAYMLEGFDKDWIYTDASLRIASYSNLPSKNYVFKVKASNSDGIWNPVPATLSIIVNPPFWATSWAYILYLLIIIGLLYVFYIYSAKMASLKSKLLYESLIREKEHELHQNKLQFFTHISHEIKTPLTLILSPIERLLQMDEGNNRVQNQLMIMKRNGDRLLKLISQLLDFRKFETGNAELHLAESNIIIFLKEVCISFEQYAHQKNISFEFIQPEEPIVFPFDKDKLEKVLFNLLSNAFKYTNERGRVQLKVTTSGNDINGGNLVIQVIDNGKGIPGSRLSSIFEPFNREDKDQVEGTGLGLFFSKSLVELHHGTIEVSSSITPNNENITCFTVSLPLKYDYLNNSTIISNPEHLDLSILNNEELEGFPISTVFETGSTEHPIKIDGRKPIILLVEDNYELREYLNNYLVEFYTTILAKDGQDGIDTATSTLPDLIVSDVMMPGKSGMDLCKALKSDLRTSHIPIILLTALSPIGFKMEGFETGADDYITKPFNLSLLNTRIKNLIMSRIVLRERFKTEFALQPSNVAITSPDEKFLNKALQYIEERIADPDLNVEDICKAIGLSRTHLYRKTKALTGLSMAEVIRNVRLKRAVQILEQEKLNINEVAYMVGYLDVDYFRKCFKSQFGYTPSEYQKSILNSK